MDENKEATAALTSEETAAENDNLQDAPQTGVADALNDASDKDTNIESETDQADNAVPEQSSTEAEEKFKKKKSFIMSPIKAAFAIVAAAAVCLLVCMLFFNNGITGTWHYTRTVYIVPSTDATPDEVQPETIDVDYYFTFTAGETAEGALSSGTVESSVGSVTSSGTYSIYKDDVTGENLLTVSVPDTVTGQSVIEGTFVYNQSGNIFTGKHLSLTSQQDEENKLELDSAKYEIPKIERDGDFTLKPELVGKWIFSDGTVTSSYDFKDDGTVVYHEKSLSFNQYTYSVIEVDITINGIYNSTDNELTIRYNYVEDPRNPGPAEMTKNFVLDGDRLVVDGIPFINEKAATQDEATA